MKKFGYFLGSLIAFSLSYLTAFGTLQEFIKFECVLNEIVFTTFMFILGWLFAWQLFGKK